MTPEYLLHAIIEVTSQCNLKCRHCYNWWKAGENKNHHQNSYKKSYQLLNYLIKNTTVKQIVFTGGEPTISERFPELVLHARVHGKKVGIITNGCGPEKVYDELIDMQVNVMEFSIHSSQPEVHDRITGQAGSWEKAIKQMKKMIHHGILVVPVTVVTAYNHAYIQDTLQFFQDMGITSVMMNRYNIGGEGLNQAQQLSATIHQLRTTFQEANSFAEDNPLQIVSGVCTPHCILNPDDYPEIRFGSCSGTYYQRPLTFDPDGNIRMCNHSPTVAGNIYKQSLATIFSSGYTEEWKQLHVPFCNFCTRLSQCKAGCRAASEQIGLPLTHEDPIIKELGGILFTH